MDIVDAIRGYHFLYKIVIDIVEFSYKLGIIDFKYIDNFNIIGNSMYITTHNGACNDIYYDTIKIPLVCLNQNTWQKYLKDKAKELEEEEKQEAKLKEQKEFEEHKRLKEKYER